MIFVRSSLNYLRFLLLLRVLTVKAEPPHQPCDYMDTVSLDDKDFTKLDNGSYLYNETTVVPANETAIYNYTILEGSLRIPTKSHVRACICKFRPCIFICCAPEKEFYKDRCINSAEDLDPDELVNITTKDGKTVPANIFRQFATQNYRPCSRMYSFLQDDEPTNYSLFENGSILYNDKIWTKNEYCLNPAIRMKSNTFLYYPSKCHESNPFDTAKITRHGIVMLTSVPFMLITIWVYMLQREYSLKTISTCFYLLSLSVAFTTLALIHLTKNPSDMVCSILGYSTYFAFIASYSWLTVISYDLYMTLSKVYNTHTECRTFTFYSLFAWGLPTLLLGFTLYAEEQQWPKKYKPNIGGKNNCFIEIIENNKLIYFYGPGIVLISLNIILFFPLIMTFCSTLPNACKRNKLLLYLEKCGMYAQLFLIMGISWVFEFLSYRYPDKLILEQLLALVEFQGYIIFLVVVLTPSIRKDLKLRFKKLLGQKIAVDVSKNSKQGTSVTQQTSL